MPAPKFAVANGSGEPITALPADLESGTNIFEAAIKAVDAHEAPIQQAEPVSVDDATEEISSVEQQPPPKKPKGPYPVDMPLFSYTFSTGIVAQLPLRIANPDPVWLWELYDKPFHILTWQWMKHAEVPRDIQRLIVSHMQNYGQEYDECFTQWFKTLNGGATPGE